MGEVEEIRYNANMEQITFDQTKLVIVKIDEIRPNPWNPKDKGTKEYKKVVQSLKDYGQRTPIIVRENEGLEIIDGEQRWTACKELGYEKVIVYNEGEMLDKQAKELTLWYQIQVPFNEVSLAKMVSTLTSEFSEASVPFSSDQLEEMKQLVNFDWEKQEKDNLEFKENKIRTLSVVMTLEQYEIVQQAMTKVKEKAEQPISEARQIELICGDYLSGE